MNYGVVSQEQLEKIDEILTEKLIKIGVDCVIIIDMAGNIITAKDNGTSKYDVYSFAALAAGNFATVDAMAKLVGEQEFSLLFHKGTECNIHFSKIDDELLLITMFGKSISLGFLRLNVVETIEQAVTATGHEVEFFTYEGAGHAFDNPNPLFYDEAASEPARERTMEFLGRHLPVG